MDSSIIRIKAGIWDIKISKELVLILYIKKK